MAADLTPDYNHGTPDPAAPVVDSEREGLREALERLRRAAGADWHDTTIIKVKAGDLRAALAATPPPGAGREEQLDFIAQAERIRAEHDATHGEAEMCGGECIVLGLTDDDEAAPGAGPSPDLRAARFVARHWLDAVMASDELRRTGMSHPLAMVLGALDGETDPRELGISEDQHDAFRAALAECGPPEPLDVERLVEAAMGIAMEGTLDEAWKAVESALPEGKDVVIGSWPDTETTRRYFVRAEISGAPTGYGPTPEAALLALTAALAEEPPA